MKKYYLLYVFDIDHVFLYAFDTLKDLTEHLIFVQGDILKDYCHFLIERKYLTQDEIKARDICVVSGDE